MRHLHVFRLRKAAFNTTAMALIAGAMAMPGMARAQAAAPAAEEASSDKPTEDAREIVVTGTLIRGAAPVGSNAIALGQARLESVAAQSSNGLLASIPQVTNYFNRVPLADLSIAVNQIQIARPNLRNISGNSAASSGTLILVDGHRVAAAGVNQASVDPDMIPLGAIDHVDVVTEGGSATYGADAVAGTINFVTRRRFDGVKVDAHYGTASKYWQWDGSITAGKQWDTGSLWVAYSYSKSDALFGRDRSFIRFLDYSAQPYVGNDTNCPVPTTSVTTRNNAIPAFGVAAGQLINISVPINTSRCDNSQNASRIPAAERHGAMVGFSQDLDSSTTIDIRAFYSQRKTRSFSDYAASVPINSNNPYASSLVLPAGTVIGPGVARFGANFLPTTTSAQVGFNLSPLVGPGAATSDVLIKEYGTNAELKHQFGSNWEARALVNWSETSSSYNLRRLNTTRLNAASAPSAPATTATAFNPIDVTKNNPAVVADLIDNEIAGQTKNSLVNLRLILEGKLLALPAGDVRLALGAEYMNDRLGLRQDTDIRLGTLASKPFTLYSRNVTSLFGELLVPLIAGKDGRPVLTVAASGRYDHYSDFGNTTNPKLGVTFKPVSWFTLRGNWGTSFTAPTGLDQLKSANSTFSFFPFVPFTDATHPSVTGGTAIALQGSQAGLKPQTATTWSVGFDVQPVSSLKLSANYYDVNFKDILATPTPNAGIFTQFPNNVLYGSSLSQTQVNAFFANRGPYTASQQAQLASSIAAAGTNPIVELVDFRTGNFGILHVKGIDFNLNYRHETGFGGFDLSVSGNHQISRKTQVSPNAPVTDDASGQFPQWFLQAGTGVDVGSFRAQASLNYTGGYNLASPTVSVPVQTKIGSFTTVNLFFKYQVPSTSGILKDLSLTLNVDNVFDQAPPVFLGNTTQDSGYANGFTLGRLFNFGISKKF